MTLEDRLNSAAAGLEIALDGAPDFQALDRRGRQRQRRRAGVLLLGLLPILAVTVALVGRGSGNQISVTADLGPAGSLSSAPVYYWPSVLPEGWSIVGVDESADQGESEGAWVFAALSDDGLILGAALAARTDGTLATPLDPRATPSLHDGIEYQVTEQLAEDPVGTVTVQWIDEGAEFWVSGRGFNVADALELASRTKAEVDPSSGLVAAIDLPALSGFETFLEPGPIPSSPSGVNYRLRCPDSEPEPDPGHECVYRLSVGPAIFDSTELTRAFFQLDPSAAVALEGGMLVWTDPALVPLGSAIMLRPPGMVAWFGPGLSFTSGGPALSSESRQAILLGLQGVDEATFLDRIQEIDRG